MTMSLIQKIYDEVHVALWAVLVAFICWFAVFVVPKLPEIHARAQILHDHEIAVEQDLYCGELGMGSKTAAYHQCIAHLEEYRAKIQQRISDEANLFP